MIMGMSEWQLHISLAELRRSFEVLLKHAEAAAGGDIVRLNEDHFWSIPRQELYDPTSVPTNLTLGGSSRGRGNT
ncbi:hypothetical protein [Nocardia sp. NPDC056000]|uniref:hypothetical protein n=1 Tax=Nocardia sp. NPDC056000 TaxID=3345674 RepID=UPI0035D5EC71